jgi:hypothetical protein
MSAPGSGAGGRCWPSCWWAARLRGIFSVSWRASLLAEQGLTTPLLLADGLQEGEGGWLLFEFLEGAESLGDAWQPSNPAGAGGRAIGGAGRGAGRYRPTARQRPVAGRPAPGQPAAPGRSAVPDRRCRDRRNAGQPLSRQKVLENLGVFFAQLPKSWSRSPKNCWYYLLSNSEHALPLEALQKQIAKVRAWRLKDYLIKVGRECTLFSVQRGAFGLRAIRREEEAAMLPVLGRPMPARSGPSVQDRRRGERWQSRGGRAHAGDQALQHQRLRALAQALLAPEPRLAFVA